MLPHLAGALRQDVLALPARSAGSPVSVAAVASGSPVVEVQTRERLAVCDALLEACFPLRRRRELQRPLQDPQRQPQHTTRHPGAHPDPERALPSSRQHSPTAGATAKPERGTAAGDCAVHVRAYRARAELLRLAPRGEPPWRAQTGGHGATWCLCCARVRADPQLRARRGAQRGRAWNVLRGGGAPLHGAPRQERVRACADPRRCVPHGRPGVGRVVARRRLRRRRARRLARHRAAAARRAARFARLRREAQLPRRQGQRAEQRRHRHEAPHRRRSVPAPRYSRMGRGAARVPAVPGVLDELSKVRVDPKFVSTSPSFQHPNHHGGRGIEGITAVPGCGVTPRTISAPLLLRFTRRCSAWLRVVAVP